MSISAVSTGIVTSSYASAPTMGDTCESVPADRAGAGSPDSSHGPAAIVTLSPEAQAVAGKVTPELLDEARAALKELSTAEKALSETYVTTDRNVLAERAARQDVVLALGEKLHERLNIDPAFKAARQQVLAERDAANKFLDEFGAKTRLAWEQYTRPSTVDPSALSTEQRRVLETLKSPAHELQYRAGSANYTMSRLASEEYQKAFALIWGEERAKVSLQTSTDQLGSDVNSARVFATRLAAVAGVERDQVMTERADGRFELHDFSFQKGGTTYSVFNGGNYVTVTNADGSARTVALLATPPLAPYQPRSASENGAPQSTANVTSLPAPIEARPHVPTLQQPDGEGDQATQADAAEMQALATLQAILDDIKERRP